MYFPYVRGRQFELLALKELLANELLSKKVLPVVEPVKLSSTLVNTIDEFAKRNREIAVIRNPAVGSFFDDWLDAENDSKAARYVERFDNLFTDNHIIKSIIMQKQADELLNIWKQDGIKINDLISIITNRDFLDMYENCFEAESPKYVLAPGDRSFTRKIKSNKVILEDRFEKQERNADYGKHLDESFSEDHLYYSEEGFVGFSDYSVIGSEYMEAGFAPYTVVIHIVYFDNNKALRVCHFVSKSNEDIFNPALKYYEAVSELAKWYQEKKDNVFLTLGLKTFLQHHKDQSYPGLGTVKKLSIMHHLELMSRYLDGEK